MNNRRYTRLSGIVITIMAAVIIGGVLFIKTYDKKNDNNENKIIDRPEVHLQECKTSTEIGDFSNLRYVPKTEEDIKVYNGSAQLVWADLSNLDLSNNKDILSKLSFSSKTVWPELLPSGFNPQDIMENGIQPGLGITKLHKKGIDGSNVNIAIVDYTLYTQHSEYANQIEFYAKTESAAEYPEMHGALVTSLAVGKNIGVAPAANLYYVGSNNVIYQDDEYGLDYSEFAEAVDGIVTLNMALPKEQKIRVISISTAWTKELQHSQDLDAAVLNANNNDIFVVTCNLFDTNGYYLYGAYKDYSADSDDSTVYTPYDWDTWIGMVQHIPGFIEYYQEKIDEFEGTMLVIPCSSRTTAYPTGQYDYAFNSDGGWSSMEPYLAGVYALACQVRPDITYQEFMELAIQTGDDMQIPYQQTSFKGKLINPKALIEAIQQQ